MDERQRKEIDPYINCILCGICFGSCPAFKLDSGFLGPAMLAKAFRFFLDPRDGRGDKILKIVNSSRAGVWACKTVFNCVEVCPKEVPPTRAIVKMRGKILKGWLRSFCLRLKQIVLLYGI
jgi:succinate dehydrogenase / fumarate reductase iron-sulfur subunit